MSKKKAFRRVKLSNWGYMPAKGWRVGVPHEKGARPQLKKKTARGVGSTTSGKKAEKIHVSASNDIKKTEDLQA